MILQAALNGRRTRAEHPDVPISTPQLLRHAAEAIAAGANVIHFHARDFYGNETLEERFVTEQVRALKKMLPRVPVSVSTGEWIEPDLEKRLEHIRTWYYLPDFVSVNTDEAGFEAIMTTAAAKKMKVEAGLADASAAQRLIDSGLFKTCDRFLIEPRSQNLAEALETVTAIEQLIKDRLPHQLIVLHGVDETSWDIMRVAKQRGYGIRTGLEDTLVTVAGTVAPGNGALVSDAVRIGRSL